MDDGLEMSDGVQAKVPIRGQPEGGVSLTGANGRRLGETATVLTAQPRLLESDRTGCCVSALLCISLPHICGPHLSAHCIQRVCVYMFALRNCMRLQKVPLCMYGHECGRKTEGKDVKCACVWVAEERGA